ncbi:MAG TPA: helix-turn-helix domain-containing protein [Candidatus Thermoplasmatota archaeon]|nr:helix-turn-helix domain-containing protein [Candidatus Thermoplasmatota archaeon]
MMFPSHLLATLLIGLLVSRVRPFDARDWALAVGFGVVIDLDHLLQIPAYVATHGLAALRPAEMMAWGAGWQGFMHTPWALLVVAAATLAFWTWIPFAFWSLHMFQDFVVARHWVRYGSPTEVAITVALATVVAALAWRRREWLLLVLYTRLRPDRVLDHPTRRAIRDLAHAEPGILLADIQKRIGLANGALRHHVDSLERAKVLRSVHEGQYRRIYPAEAPRVQAAPGLADRVVLALHEHGPLPAAELAARLGVSRQSLHYHVKRLAAQGRIETRMVDRELVVALGPPRGDAPGAAP